MPNCLPGTISEHVNRHQTAELPPSPARYKQSAIHPSHCHLHRLRISITINPIITAHSPWTTTSPSSTPFVIPPRSENHLYMPTTPRARTHLRPSYTLHRLRLSQRHLSLHRSHHLLSPLLNRTEELQHELHLPRRARSASRSRELSRRIYTPLQLPHAPRPVRHVRRAPE
jgi:hypothetical protein